MKNLFLSFSLLLVSFAAGAQVIESIEFRHYEISPRTPAEIKPELMRHSPIRTRYGSYNGRTDWHIDWKSRSTHTHNGCQLTATQTRVHVVYTLPALSKRVHDPQTIDVFNTFNDALTQHELNHGKHGLAAAREMDRLFNEIPPQRNCRILARIVDDIGNATVRKYAQLDRDYDRRTRNGETEGAVIH